MVALFGSRPSSPGNGHEKYQLVSSVASEAMGIGKSSQVLTVLGGKASCRRKFVLNIHLVDELGRLVSRDLTVVASVAYAHDLSPVVRDEKPFLAEPPLFTTFNGVEFPAQDRPTRMVSGRASFKLAISLLSSKCDNRLFCICFSPQAAAGDATPICAPCYSKPIRSISRKRTQSSTHVPPPPQLRLTGLEKSLSTSSAARQYTNKINNEGGASFVSDSGLGGSKFGASPSTSSEDDGEGVASPPGRGANLQFSSRSGSVTSMHYLSPPPTAAGLGAMLDEAGARKACTGVALIVHESSNASAQSTAETTAGLSTAPERAGGLERFIDMETSGSSTGGCLASVSCSPVSSTTPVDIGGSDPMKVTTPPCSLSLRLSPSDSGSPTSGPLTSGSSYENTEQQQQQPKEPPSSRTMSPPLAVGSSRPSFNAPSFPQPAANARPFRPFATVGPCKVLTASDFQLGNGISLARQSARRCDDGGGGGQASNNNNNNNLLERVNQVSEVAPNGRHHQQGNGSKVDSVLHSFTLGTEVRSSSSNGDDKFNPALTEISLEEEERSLQYIEVSLQEVSREVQRRMGELRSKRRRLLEDEARMHSIIFQSASWIESLSGRYSL